MRLLIDAHVFVWACLGNPRLSMRTIETLEEPANEVFISTVTIYEIAIKIKRQKIELPRPILSAVEHMGFETLAYSASHAERAAELEWHHLDPFDRSLVAVAVIEDLALLTSDGAVLDYRGPIRPAMINASL